MPTTFGSPSNDSGGGSRWVVPATTPTIANISVAAPSTEQSYAFPASTKSLQVRARGAGKLQISFSAGLSGTTFQTIWPGSVYTQENLNLTATTLYFQSPVAGLVLEITSWA